MCTSPNYMAWQGRHWCKTGKPRLDFIPHGNYDSLLKSGVPFIEVPCGKCLDCQITYGKQWADRCYLESKNSPYNYFITLTYDDVHLPVGGQLIRKHFTDFMKRLRKFFGEGVRVFACGEYGEISLRPHFHAILFNCNINDLSCIAELKEADGRYHKHNLEGNKEGYMYSRRIYDLWQNKGMVTVAPFTYATAAYIAQYCTKKLSRSDKLSGLGLNPEFITMSRNPGIGANQYDDNMLLDDYMVVCNGKAGTTTQVPRYFQKLFIKKYGVDFYNDNINIIRLEKRLQSRENYNHSEKIKNRSNTLRNYRLAKMKKLRSAI